MNIVIILTAKYLFLASIIIAGIYFLRIEKSKKMSIVKLSLVSLPLAYIVAKILGHVFYNPRPFVVEHIKPLIAHAANNGFPSDHTLLTVAIASVIFVYNKTLGYILFIIALLVGTARVLAQIHHPVDIIGSTCIAIGSTVLTYLVLKQFNQNHQRKKDVS